MHLDIGVGHLTRGRLMRPSRWGKERERERRNARENRVRPRANRTDRVDVLALAPPTRNGHERRKHGGETTVAAAAAVVHTSSPIGAVGTDGEGGGERGRRLARPG